MTVLARCILAFLLNMTVLWWWKSNVDEPDASWCPVISNICAAWWLLWVVLTVQSSVFRRGAVPPPDTWRLKWLPVPCMSCGAHIPNTYRGVSFAIFDDGWAGGLGCDPCNNPGKSE